MPRFVRPAWLTVTATGVQDRAIGPRTADGSLSASLTLRTAAGTVSRPVSLDAGGSFRAHDGAACAILSIPDGFRVEITTADGTTTVYGRDDIRAVDIIPLED